VSGYDSLIFIDSSDVGMEMTHPEPAMMRMENQGISRFDLTQQLF
jgi:hypothetical protein